MYVLAVVICVALVNFRLTTASSEEYTEEEMKSIRECAKQFNISEAEIEKDDPIASKNVDHNYMCFITCTYEKMDFVDDKGVTKLDTYRKEIELKEGDVKEIAKCEKDYEAENKCERVFKTQMCILDYLYSNGDSK